MRMVTAIGVMILGIIFNNHREHIENIFSSKNGVVSVHQWVASQLGVGNQ